jgi:hypothetical protein
MQSMDWVRWFLPKEMFIAMTFYYWKFLPENDQLVTCLLET